MSSPIPSSLKVLLLGATGTAGVHIVNGFLLPEYASKVVLSLLSRQSTAETAGPKKDLLDGWIKQGAKIVYGDISTASEDELVKIFTGQQVIVSAVGSEQLASQPKYIAAAKKAGVTWFVPSEFGSDGEGVGRGSAVPIFDAKLDTADALQKSGLDYTYVNTGGFAEYILSPFLGLDIANSTLTAQGGLDVAFNTTPLAEIGRQTADAVVTGRGRNQILYTGETITFAQLGDIVERATGKKLLRQVRTVAEAEAAVQANPNDYQARFSVVFGKGKGTSWPASQTYAAKNNFKVQTFEEFAKKALAAK
jgi:uncharacterized protein YbjT (DUF2867 family)